MVSPNLGGPAEWGYLSFQLCTILTQYALLSSSWSTRLQGWGDLCGAVVNGEVSSVYWFSNSHILFWMDYLAEDSGIRESAAKVAWGWVTAEVGGQLVGKESWFQDKRRQGGAPPHYKPWHIGYALNLGGQAGCMHAILQEMWCMLLNVLPWRQFSFSSFCMLSLNKTTSFRSQGDSKVHYWQATEPNSIPGTGGLKALPGGTPDILRAT